jgi:hypothetical protein
MVSLGEATWGDLEGLSSFDASFELSELNRDPTKDRGWSQEQQEWNLEFTKLVKKIVTRKVE